MEQDFLPNDDFEEVGLGEEVENVWDRTISLRELYDELLARDPNNASRLRNWVESLAE